MPAIYNCYKEGKIKNLKIISNFGTYYCTEEGEYGSNLGKELNGTLFYWEIENNIGKDI